MNFKMTVLLFIFALCFLGAKSTFAMADLGKYIEQLEKSNKENALKEKKRKILEDLFDKGFKDRDLEKCLKYFIELGKVFDNFAEDIVLSSSSKFVMRYRTNKEDSKFFKEIIKKYKEQSEDFVAQELQKAHDEGDANKFVACYKKFQSKLAPGDYILNIPDSKFRAEVAALLSKEDDVDLHILHPEDIKKLSDELHKSVAKEDCEGISKFVQAGGDKNAHDAIGFAPVHNAVKAGKLNSLKKLDELGADFTRKTRRGNTVLHLAAVNYSGDSKVACQIMSYLLKLCKNLIEVKTSRGGWTPLHCAVGHGNLDLLILLIQAEADIKAVTNNGENIRDLAKQFGHENVMKFLSAVEFDVLN